MKKVSTVTGKQLMNFVQGQATQPRFTVGLDLGDRHSWYRLSNFTVGATEPKNQREQAPQYADAHHYPT